MMGGSRGQIHPCYNLVDRHQPPEFHGTNADSLTVEDWLEVMKEAIKLFKMIDHERYDMLPI